MTLLTTEVDYFHDVGSKGSLIARGSSQRELKVQDQVLAHYYGNKNVVKLSKIQVYHKSTKHIDIKLHFMGEYIA